MTGFKRGGSRGGGFKKGGAKKRAASEDEDSAPRVSKKSKGKEEDSAPVVPELKDDDEGGSYIALNANGKRRATVRNFKDVPLIDIREYWINDDDELKPGKKGISLTVDQYITLLTAAPLIESALAKQNVQVPRPDYDADLNATKAPKDKDTVEATTDDETEEAVGKGSNEEGDNEE